MDFITKFIPKSQQDVLDKANALIEEKNIKQEIFDEASLYSQKVFQNLVNPDEDVDRFEQLQIDKEIEMIKFYLVLDFLESIGCKFTPSVFQNETQMTNHFFDRQYLEEKLKLRKYDKTPMLVQLIEELRMWTNQKE
ncbi:hypothetical protein M9Y10_011508 [Tritrichomonas musculus]|uniref:Uncharacterized protein n=1 Tax=Tritrichomonas musculus TaxID=1915356 RepID=A0ABR2IKY2_9EUKA